MNSSALMRSLGRPAREQIVSTRPNTLTTLQALDLANGTDLASNLSEGAARLLGRFESSNQLIEHVYRAALSRPPTEEEMRLAVDFLGETPVKERVADFLWAVIMLPDFQMVR